MISIRRNFREKFRIDLRNIIIYPYLLAIYPVLSLFVQNIKLVRITEVRFAILVQIGLITSTIFVLNKLTNNKRKSSLIASWLPIIATNIPGTKELVVEGINGIPLDGERLKSRQNK